MIPRNRRIPRAGFMSLQKSHFRQIVGSWYSARIYPGDAKQSSISVVVSAKVAGGVRRNALRRALYDSLGKLTSLKGRVVLHVRSYPADNDAIALAGAHIKQEIK